MGFKLFWLGVIYYILINSYNFDAMKRIFAILLFTFFALLSNYSQPDHAHGGEEIQDHKGAELGLGTGVVFAPGEQETGYGIHLHGIRRLTPYLGIGAGYEIIIGDHGHHTVSALLNLKPVHFVEVNMGPGLILPGKEHDHAEWTLHGELGFPFALTNNLHLGPMVDLGWSPDETHYMVGVHLGVHL